MWLQLFLKCATVADIKILYRKLAKEHHPDHGGDTRTMQDINAAYLTALERHHGDKTTDTEGKEHVYHYNAAVEQAIMDKIAELLAFKMPGVEIEVIGFWIWIHGDTYPNREQLKAAKCEWHGKRQMWYWRQVRSIGYSGRDFDTLRAMYGSRTFSSSADEPNAVAAV